ncbi:MAG: nucleotidyltransferase domain-containing protein, partial [Cyanobacteriota bacterium]
VTREALSAFTQRLVEHFAPEQIILFGSMARGEARWDSDADILVVMPLEGQPRDTVEALLAAGAADFPLDLHLRQPEDIVPRYRWGDPYLREAMDHGELLHGALDRGTLERPNAPIPMRNPVVDEWSARAERHWRMAQLLTDLPPGYLSGLFQVQRCLETYLRAVLIAQDVPSRKCRDLLTLSGRLRLPIPGWQPDPEMLNTLTQAALAYQDPGEGHPEPSHDMTRVIAEVRPLRDGLRHWFDSLDSPTRDGAPQQVA